MAHLIIPSVRATPNPFPPPQEGAGAPTISRNGGRLYVEDSAERRSTS
jgi:hypothetical protein